MPALTVAIVNDYPVVVRGVEAMLQPFSDRVRVTETVAGQEPEGPVDVTLYDAFAGAQVLPRAVDDLLGDPRRGRVLVYAWDLAPAAVRTALAQGCAGYVDKGVSAEQLVSAIERAASGEAPVERGPHPVGEGSPGGGRWPGMEADLSQREAEVVALITQGLTNPDIGARLHLSINTVKTYIRAAYLKMGVSRRSQAVKWGLEHGMLPDVGDES